MLSNVELTKLIRYCIKRYYSKTCLPYDDLFQIGYEGALKCMDKLNPEIPEAHASYFLWHIRAEINKALLKEREHLAYSFEDYEETLYVDQTSLGWYDEILSLIDKRVIKMKDNERYVFSKVFHPHERATLSEVGNILGVSAVRIHQILKSAIKKIQIFI